MSLPLDHERLLDEVLADGLPADFRETLLGETLRLVRRRRRARQARRAGATLAVLAALVALVWKNVTTRPGTDGAAIVRTRPLPAGALVVSRPLPAECLVTSVRTAGLVTTPPGGGPFRVIGDDELLALVAPTPVALVRWTPHEAELVFVNPRDRAAWLRN